MVYELLPTYAGRPWQTNRVVAMAWGAVLFLILFAYFHHLYMDFAQPTWIQKFGQISSYLLSVPAGGGVHLWHSCPGLRLEDEVDAGFDSILSGHYGLGHRWDRGSD